MKAWELLDKPEKWTQGAFARNKHGDRCGLTTGNAVQWCLLGAVEHCYGAGYNIQREKIRDKLGGDFPSTWNDKDVRTYEEVHALLKELDI